MLNSTTGVQTTKSRHDSTNILQERERRKERGSGERKKKKVRRERLWINREVSDISTITMYGFDLNLYLY